MGGGGCNPVRTLEKISGSSIVVVGSGGRLGAAVARHFEATGRSVHCCDRAAMDLADAKALRRVLEPLEFGVLFNSAALTNVDYCEGHAEEAFAVNADGPEELAAICAERGARMVHVSTDYVYTGDAEGVRRECDPTRPASVYGQSKLAGEEAVFAALPDALVLRTSWVFGPDRPSFIDMILRKAREDGRVEAIADKESSPTYSVDFAELLVDLLDKAPSLSGLFNVCNTGGCSWREYAQFAIDCAGEAGIPLKARTVQAKRLDQFTCFKAERPVFTSMSTDKFSKAVGVTPRSWRDAVRDYVGTIAPADSE